MKRVVAGVFAALLLGALPSAAWAAAEAQRYELDEAGMSIEIPAEYTVLTRDSDFESLGFGAAKDGILTSFTLQNIYLDAWPGNEAYEILVTVEDSALKNFNLFSDTVLSAMMANLPELFEQNGNHYIESEFYSHAQAKYIKVYFSQTSGDFALYGLRYFTIYENKAIQITMQSESPIDSEKSAILESIVDSTVFPTAAPVTSPAFIYRDAETGASFTVPENWSKAELSEERDYLDAKFTRSQAYGVIILYGGTDLWAKLPASERVGISRADVDLTMFTKAEMAEIFKTTPDRVERVTYGGEPYYRAEISETQTLFGVDITVKSTLLSRTENGMLYYFQFSAPMDSEYFNEFEALLDSMVYPAAESDSRSAAAVAADTGVKRPWDKEQWINSFLVGLVVTILLQPLPVFVYRHAVRKAPMKPGRAAAVSAADAAVVFIIMWGILTTTGGVLLPTVGILIWGLVNYSILAHGYCKKTAGPVGRGSPDAGCGSMSEAAPTPGAEETPAGGPEPMYYMPGGAPKAAQEPCAASNDTPPGPEMRQGPEAGSGRRCCRICGASLTEDNIYCGMCGTKITDKVE